MFKLITKLCFFHELKMKYDLTKTKTYHISIKMKKLQSHKYTMFIHFKMMSY
jgi:hypothetical protein